MTENELIKAFQPLADRMKLLRKMRRQAEERGETVIELHPAELYDNKDDAALNAFDEYMRIRNGERPLFEV